MSLRTAACSCGQLSLTVTGDPDRVSICHCTACQRRTGSAFGVQARFAADQVQMTGRSTEYARTSDERDRRVHVFHFCPDCGGTVYYTEPDEPEMVAVAVGAFADPSFPAPTTSIYDARRHPWVALPSDIESDAPWETLLPLYQAEEYAEAAERGRRLVEEYPANGHLAYNVACCESMAGQTEPALAHLRLAFERSEGLRSQAADDPDLDPIRDAPGFAELVGTQ